MGILRNEGGSLGLRPGTQGRMSGVCDDVHLTVVSKEGQEGDKSSKEIRLGPGTTFSALPLTPSLQGGRV